MSKKIIRWGILGSAWIAKERLIPAIQSQPDNELLAIASRTKEKAMQFSESYAIPRAYGSYEELLADPDIDAVYIPLPNHMHAKWTILAAEAGKHVLCEKPAALTVKEVEEMTEACRKNGVLFMEAYAFRTHPDWLYVKELIDSGYIGEIKNIQARYSIMVDRMDDIRLNPEVGGGVLYDIGSYCVNGICYLMGAEPLEVSGYASRDAQDVDRSIVVSMRFSDGRLAQFDCTFESSYNQTLEISGNKGIIKIHFPFRDPQITIQKNDVEERKVFQDRVNPYITQIKHFSSCIKNGTSPLYSSEETINNMKVIERIYQSLN